MRQKTKTIPNLAENSHAHQDAIALGNDHFKLWERNVTDDFKDKSEEEIKTTLKKSAHPFAVCFENWIGDFNLGTGIRNANAFNAEEVFYVGNKKWDRRSAVGVYNYTNVQWVPTIEDFVKLQEKYVIVGIDNVPGSISLSTYNYPLPCLLVFGEEGVGLTPAMQSLCKDILHIDMYGSVRSLNCGTASGIAMYDLVGKIKKS